MAELAKRQSTAASKQQNSAQITYSLRQPPHDRSACSYTACYCEENIWQLCAYLTKPIKPKPGEEPENYDALAPPPSPAICLAPYFVVFVSNPQQQVLLFRQQAGHPPNGMIVWDYHVLLVGKLIGNGGKSVVYDLDSTLDFPTTVSDYFSEALKSDTMLPNQWRRNFRVIPAAQFFARFASDRRHMKQPDGSWQSPPPPYGPIQGSEASTNFNLDKFIDMNPDMSGYGIVLKDAFEFLSFFSRDR